MFEDAENFYRQFTERNIDLLTEEQQEILKKSKVAIFGLGGIGGPVAEILARSGIGCLGLVDNECYETTNLNRQIFASCATVGSKKVEAARERLQSINPFLSLSMYEDLNEASIIDIMSGADVAVLAIDKIRPCLMISRTARKQNVPLVEGWAIPFGNVRVISENTPSLEEMYAFNCCEKNLDNISPAEYELMEKKMLMSLEGIQGLDRFYSPQLIEKIFTTGRVPSFAPMVWLTSVLMAIEVVKIILQWEPIAYAPHYAVYDPFTHCIPSQQSVKS